MNGASNQASGNEINMGMEGKSKDLVVEIDIVRPRVIVVFSSAPCACSS